MTAPEVDWVVEVAKVLHARHTMDDGRPLKGYNHCDCIAAAKEVLAALDQPQPDDEAVKVSDEWVDQLRRTRAIEEPPQPDEVGE